jgi:uncharacterized metal-binding protein
VQRVSLVNKGPLLNQLVLTTAILAAPFIAWLYSAEAGLVVMAVALSAGSFVLTGALDVSPEHMHRWVRLGIVVNLTLAAACLALALWLLLR